MFFSSDMLSKRGPLAKVWLAAHVERRLSKVQLLTTSIPQSVDAILDPSTTTEVPLALRLSGQLLLGVTRIYSRKAKYLLDDCNEALLKIKMAFRTGGGAAAVDMSEEQEAAGREGLNLKEKGNMLDFELMYGGAAAYDAPWDFDHMPTSKAVNGRAGGGASRIDADIGDITLPEHDAMGMGGGDGNNYDLDLAGFGGIDSQDFDLDLDLGLDFEEGGLGGEKEGDVTASKRRMSLARDADDTIEMEVGRDAPASVDRRSARDSMEFEMEHDGASFKAGSLGPEMTMDAHDAGQLDLDFDTGGAFELDPGAFNMDLDLGLDENGLAPMAGSREATPVPSVRGDAMEESLNITPRTAKRIAELPTPKAAKENGQKRRKRAIVDSVIELESGVGQRGFSSQGVGKDTRQDRIDSGLFVEPVYLPASRIEMRLMEIRADPGAYYLPKIERRGETEWLIAAPPGICDELRDLFRFPVRKLPFQKAAGKRRTINDDEEHDADGRADKRARSGTVESEVGLHRERSIGGGSEDNWDVGMDQPMEMGGDMGGGFDEDFRFDIGGGDVTDGDAGVALDDREDGNTSKVSTKARPKGIFDCDASAGLPLLDGDCVLSVFDEASTETQQQTQAPDTQGHKTQWSKNTVKALNVLQHELDEDDSKTMNFTTVSGGASRRAASAFFFELLVLGTRDCVGLKQDEAYGDVCVTAKARLWEVVVSERLAEKS